MVSAHTFSIADLLSEDRIALGVEASSRDEVLESLMELAVADKAVESIQAVKDAVFARERQMSTGVGSGVALPHARTTAVAATLLAFATLATPVDFHSVDGKPVNLVFLLVGPEGERSEHVRLLGRISRLISDVEMRIALASARSTKEVLTLFAANRGQEV